MLPKIKYQDECLHHVGEIGPFTLPNGQDTMVTQYAMTREEWAADNHE